MQHSADSIPSQEQARRAEVERDPLRWILDALSSLEDDPDDPPPTIVSCEEVRGCSVSCGGSFSLEWLDAICVDASARRWSLSLAVGFDSGSYWQQPESEIVATWELQGAADMDHIEGYAGEVLVEAEKPVVQQGGDALTMFAAARDALRSERDRLMAEKDRIDGQIAAIDAALAPSPVQTSPEVFSGKFSSAPASRNTGITGRGATAAIRALFMAAPDRRVDFSQIVAAVGSGSRAGALCQNMLRSGQIKKIRTGKFIGTDKLVQFAAAD